MKKLLKFGTVFCTKTRGNNVTIRPDREEMGYFTYFF